MHNNEQPNVFDAMDVSGRTIKLKKRVEKPICDSDNSKTITRFTRIDGSAKIRREDLIIDENAIDTDLLIETAD